MTAGYLGMDPDVIESVGARLRRQSEALQEVMGNVDRLAGRAQDNWGGHDAQQFVSTWRGRHRSALSAAQQAVAGMAQVTVRQAQEQRAASGSVTSGYGGVARSRGGWETDRPVQPYDPWFHGTELSQWAADTLNHFSMVGEWVIRRMGHRGLGAKVGVVGRWAGVAGGLLGFVTAGWAQWQADVTQPWGYRGSRSLIVAGSTSVGAIKGAALGATWGFGGGPAGIIVGTAVGGIVGGLLGTAWGQGVAAGIDDIVPTVVGNSLDVIDWTKDTVTQGVKGAVNVLRNSLDHKIRVPLPDPRNWRPFNGWRMV